MPMASKCQFRRNDGRRCGANAQSGKTLCVFHDPARAAAGRRARRLGGINRSRAAAILPPETPDNPLSSTQDVSLLLGESINQVRRGQLDPRVANALGYLASSSCLEFIVAHEMAHLLERHHNERFKGFMDALSPNWRLHREQLN
jgi:YgjP-like, metallopeptidase domain